MRFLRYKCDLPPDMLLERFGRFTATETHNPFKPFSGYYNPRVGLHTYVKGNGVSGYYENGSRKRGGDLQTMKVWFELSVKPHGEGSTVTCVIFSSPYFLLLALFVLIFAFSVVFTEDAVAGGIMLGFAAVMILLEAWDQKHITEEIRTLAPKQKPKNKSQ